MSILAIDIGGTSIKSNLYAEDGTSQDAFQERTTRIDYRAGTNGILEQVADLVEEYAAKHVVEGVAISSAGVIDPKKGEVTYSGYTIPGYRGTNFKEAIESRFGFCCSVENDVNCAALGEYWLGAGRGSQSLVCLTIGTGIGGSILLDGHTWYGHSYSAGEVGYIKVQGRNWQDVASTTALCRHYGQLIGEEKVDGKQILEAYQKGEAEALEAVGSFVAYFAEGLLPLLYLYNPECLLLGGGIMTQSALLLPKIERKMGELLEDSHFLPAKIRPAQLGNEAGRLGAVYKFLEDNQLPIPFGFRG